MLRLKIFTPVFLCSPRVPTHLPSADAHAAVVEPQLLQSVAGGALEQLLDALHAVGPKRVVAEVEDCQPSARQYQGVAQ